MPDTGYALESLLKLRRREAESAKWALAKAQTERSDLVAERDELSATLGEIDRQLRQEGAVLDHQVDREGATVAALLLFEERQAGLRDDKADLARRLAGIEAALAGAGDEVKRCQEALASALAVQRALERHRARWESAQANRQRAETLEDQDPLPAHREAGARSKGQLGEGEQG